MTKIQHLLAGALALTAISVGVPTGRPGETTGLQPRNDATNRVAPARTRAKPPRKLPAQPDRITVLATNRPIYKPPPRGAPSVTVNAGTRGIAFEVPALLVLAPDHPGLTTQEQPTLSWYISRPTTAKVELTLHRENEAKPLLTSSLPGVSRAGIQSIRLAKEGVKLELDVEYEWVVALVVDPGNRVKDVVASGVVKRVPATAALRQALAAQPAAQASLYAEHGLWYDALQTLLERWEANPSDALPRDQLKDLLDQVGLTRVNLAVPPLAR